MRDKGRAVLIALGWRFKYSINGKDYGYAPCDDPNDDPYYRELPDLSDHGTFWPLFLKWIATNDLQFQHESCWGKHPCKEPCHHFDIYKAETGPEPYSHGDGPRGGVTEAGINAWHSALVALGKIREGR